MEQDWAQMCYLSCLNCLFLDSVAQTAFAQQLNTMLTASWNTLGQELLQGFGTWLSGQHTEKKMAPEKLKSGLKCKHFFSFFCVQAPSKPSQMLISLFHYFWTLHSIPAPPPPTNWNCFHWSKIEPFCNGETLRKLAHKCVYKNVYILSC